MGKTYTVEEWFEVTDLTQPKKDKIKKLLEKYKKPSTAGLSNLERSEQARSRFKTFASEFKTIAGRKPSISEVQSLINADFKAVKKYLTQGVELETPFESKSRLQNTPRVIDQRRETKLTALKERGVLEPTLSGKYTGPDRTKVKYQTVWPNEEVKADYIEDFLKSYEKQPDGSYIWRKNWKPEGAKTNLEMANTYLTKGRKDPAAISYIANINNTLKDELNLKFTKAPETETKSVRTRRVKEGRKFLSPREKSINAKQNKVVAKLNAFFKNNPKAILKYPSVMELMNVGLDKKTGELIDKGHTADYFMDKAKKGNLFSIDHIDEVRTGKRNIEFPINRQLSPQTFNQGPLNSMKAWLGHNWNNADKAPQKKAILDFFEKYNIRKKIPNVEGVQGAKEIAVFEDTTKALPSFNKTLSTLNLDKLPKGGGKSKFLIGSLTALGAVGAGSVGFASEPDNLQYNQTTGEIMDVNTGEEATQSEVSDWIADSNVAEAALGVAPAAMLYDDIRDIQTGKGMAQKWMKSGVKPLMSKGPAKAVARTLARATLPLAPAVMWAPWIAYGMGSHAGEGFGAWDSAKLTGAQLSQEILNLPQYVAQMAGKDLGYELDYYEKIKAQLAEEEGLNPDAAIRRAEQSEQNEIDLNRQYDQTYQGAAQGGLMGINLPDDVVAEARIFKSLGIPLAQGGRVGYGKGKLVKKGPEVIDFMRRRITQGLAALLATPLIAKVAPLVGKTKVAKVAPAIAKVDQVMTAGMDPRFWPIVNTILKNGEIIEGDKFGKTYKLKSKNGGEITMEHRGDGSIDINFDTDQGMPAGWTYTPQRLDVDVDKYGAPKKVEYPAEFQEGELVYRGHGPEGDYTKDWEEEIVSGTEWLNEFAQGSKSEKSLAKVDLESGAAHAEEAVERAIMKTDDMPEFNQGGWIRRPNAVPPLKGPAYNGIIGLSFREKPYRYGGGVY